MEVWKPVHNFPSYNCSNKGKIINVRTQHILKTYINDKGYEIVCLRKNNKQYTISVHKLIAETFLGEHPGMDIHHKDSNRSNNSVENLEYVTRQETVRKSFSNGNRLPSRQIPIRVIETGNTYESIRACARELKCSQIDICRYLAGKSKHVKGYHFERL